MAIVVTHKFEGRLPPSALYLDDVNRIVEIIRDKTPDLYKPKQDASGAVIWGSGTAVKLTVGDTTCDTVDELAQLGDSTHNLRVSTNWCSLDLDAEGASWRCLDETAEREIYGLFLPIFMSRRRSLPMLWGSKSFYSFIKGASIPLLFGAGLVLMSLNRTVLALCAWIAGGALMMSTDRLLPYSTIYLRRKYDRVPDTARWLPRKDEIVKIVFTAAVSGVVGWLIGRASK